MWEKVDDEQSHTTRVQLQITQMTLGAAALGRRQAPPWTSLQLTATPASQQAFTAKGNESWLRHPEATGDAWGERANGEEGRVMLPLIQIIAMAMMPPSTTYCVNASTRR